MDRPEGGPAVSPRAVSTADAGVATQVRTDPAEGLARLAARAAGVPAALIAFADADGRITRVAGHSAPECEGWDPMAFAALVVARLIAAGETVFVRDAAAGPRAYAALAWEADDGATRGLCCLLDNAVRTWDGDAVDALRDFADAARDLGVSIAMQPRSGETGAPNDGLAHDARLARLHVDIAYALTMVSTTRERLQRCAELVVEHLDAAFARVWTLNEAEQVLELQASAGLYTHLDGEHARVPVGAFKIGLIASERTPHLTNEVIGDPRVNDQAWARREGFQSFAGYPLIIDDRLLGVVALFSRRRLSPTTLVTLEAVANALALSLERGRMDEEGRRIQQRIEAGLLASLDCVVTIDHAGTILSFNPAAESLFGCTAEEAIGREMAELIVPERYRDAHREGLRRFAATRVPHVLGQRIELSALRRDGSEFPVELAITRVPGAEPPEYTGFLRDITERKQAEVERHRRLALERAARADAEAEREKARLLSNASRVLASSLDFETTMANVVRVSAEAFAHCAAYVAQPDAGGTIRRVSSDSVGSADDVPGLSAAIDHVLRTGAAYAPAASDDVDRGGAVLAVPLNARGQLIGALAFSSTTPERRFTAEDLPLANDVALRAAFAIDNALAHADLAAANARLETQTGALERQTEELTALTDELQEQALEQERLQEELLASNEELQATNEELEERRAAIEETNAALRHGEARFRFLTEAIPVQIWTAKPDGSLDFVTEQTAAYFGHTVEEVIGAGWLGVLHPDDVDRTIAKWRHALATGEPYEVEFRLRSADAGTYRWHLARAVAFREPGGAIEKWFGSNTDIEDRKLLEAMLEEGRDAERQANLAKSRFLNMLSHELRTPLGAIGGYVDLLLMDIRGPLLPAQRTDLERVQHNQQHLYRMINDLLQLAKIEARQLVIHAEPAEVGDLVQAARVIVQPLVDGKGLELVTPAEQCRTSVFADRDRTHQILINLIGNAVKFTPSGGRITIDALVMGGTARIAVSDTGRGVPADKVATIFEPFVQAESEQDTVEGTGLGLAISRELARAMGGDLELAPRAGPGATFVLHLRREQPGR